MKIEPANKAGATMVIAKWFAETPNGWIASHDLAALQAVARRLAAAEQMAQALADAEEYISQSCSKPGDYGIGIDAAHDKYERLPLLNVLRTALVAWEAAK